MIGFQQANEMMVQWDKDRTREFVAFMEEFIEMQEEDEIEDEIPKSDTLIKMNNSRVEFKDFYNMRKKLFMKNRMT